MSSGLSPRDSGPSTFGHGSSGAVAGTRVGSARPRAASDAPVRASAAALVVSGLVRTLPVGLLAIHIEATDEAAVVPRVASTGHPDHQGAQHTCYDDQDWSDHPVPPSLRGDRYHDCRAKS